METQKRSQLQLDVGKGVTLVDGTPWFLDMNNLPTEDQIPIYA